MTQEGQSGHLMMGQEMVLVRLLLLMEGCGTIKLRLKAGREGWMEV